MCCRAALKQVGDRGNKKPKRGKKLLNALQGKWDHRLQLYNSCQVMGAIAKEECTDVHTHAYNPVGE